MSKEKTGTFFKFWAFSCSVWMCVLWNDKLLVIVLSQKIKLLCKPALMLHHVPKLWQWVPLSPAWCVSSPKISNLVISKDLLAIQLQVQGGFDTPSPVFCIKPTCISPEAFLHGEYHGPGVRVGCKLFHCSPGYWICQLKNTPYNYFFRPA